MEVTATNVVSLVKMAEIKTVYQVSYKKNGPCQAKTCIRAYADSEGPDQPAHPRSLIRVSAIR